MRKIKIITDHDSIVVVGQSENSDLWERVYDMAADYALTSARVVVKDLTTQELLAEFTRTEGDQDVTSP